MKVNEKSFNNPDAKGDITRVFEILIPKEIWERLVKVQTKHRKLTFSQITRYVLFKMIRRKNFWNITKFLRLKEIDKTYSKKRENCHRHLICLYDDDHDRLKIFGAELLVPISVLVRVALLWYFEEFETEEIPDFDQNERKSRKFGKLSFEKIKKYGTHRSPVQASICPPYTHCRIV